MVHTLVSTHSRLKAAGILFPGIAYRKSVSTHSCLKAAGRRARTIVLLLKVFQHTAA